MIRPEFRKILLDQRGAAVILWSFFVISVPIYIVIARNVLGNPKSRHQSCHRRTGANHFLAADAGRSRLLCLLAQEESDRLRRSGATPGRPNCFAPWRNSKASTKRTPPTWSRPMSRAKSCSSRSSKRSRSMVLSWRFSAASSPIRSPFALELDLVGHRVPSAKISRCV